jgi:enoyl-[acyl-carrier protein] reductase I
MGSLEGKTALVFGVADHHSAAWAIADALRREGAQLALAYMERFEKNVRKLAADIPDVKLFVCDAQSDEQLDATFAGVREAWGGLDVLVHSIAFAKQGVRFTDTEREDFKTALDISAYSLIAMSRRAEPLMQARGGGSIMTMTYQASQRVVPNYNLMAICKAALEASMRYLAYDLGPSGIRVNAISAGPFRSLSAMGVPGVRTIFDQVEEHAPLHRNITTEDVGNLGAFLASDGAKNITGQTIYVDAGHSIVAG